MNKYTRLGKNVILVFIGNAGAKLIGLLMLPFYTRWLSVEEYGAADIIIMYASVLLILASACIADSVFIFPKGQAIEKQKSYFSSGLIFAFISLSGAALVLKIVKFIFLYNSIENSFVKNIWLIYGLLVTTFLQQYMQQFARSIDKIKEYSITGVVFTICTALFSFLIVPARGGASGYIFALILANFAAALYSFIFTGAWRYFTLSFIKKNICKEMLAYSLPLIPTNIAWWLISALNRPFLEKYGGLGDIGIFSAANKLPGMLNIVFAIFQQAWILSALEEFFNDGYNRFYNKMFKMIFFIQISISCIIAVFGMPFVRLFTTSEFYSAGQYIPLLTISVLFSNISAFVGTNFSATKESKYYFYTTILGGLTSVVCNLILIPFMGIWGACISIALAHFMAALSRIAYSWKYNKITQPYIYIIMLLINGLVIMSALLIENIILKVSSYFLLFFLLLFLNRKVLHDFLHAIMFVINRRKT